MADQGTFIVLEGADGSGKGTQFRLLHQRLEAVGYEVAVFDFPRYDQPSSHFVRRYLNGEYGPAANISPYTASLFYALDRYEAAPEIKEALAEGKIVLANRFVGSNMAHMGSKIADPIEQRSFFVWEDSLEFQLLGLPRPNINIFLHVPAEVSYELIAKKASREYTKKTRDEHEADMEHLKKAVATYELLCQLFPADFVAVDCMLGNHLLDVPEINNRIWELVKQHLPSEPKKPAHSVTLKLNEEAAAPAKTERAQDDKRTERLDVGQLSLDLLTQIEALNSSLVSFELNWQASGYKYLAPAGLNKQLSGEYDKYMAELIKLSKNLKNKQAVQAIIPGGALLKATLNLDGDAETLANLLENTDTDEAAQLLAKIKHTGSPAKPAKAAPRASAKAEPEQLGHIMSKLAKDGLSSNVSADTEAVKLFEAAPRNEFKLLADIVYPYSELSIAEIESNLDKWSYQQKVDTLQAAILDRSKALDDVRYRFDLLLDRPHLHKLLAGGYVSEAKLQAASPRFGYDMPSDLTAEEETEIEEGFDKSLNIYSSLQAAQPQLAPLAVLAGHRIRAHVLIDLDKLTKLKNTKLLPGEIADQIIEKVAEVHPIIGFHLAKSPKPEPKAEPKKPSRNRRRRSHRRKH